MNQSLRNLILIAGASAALLPCAVRAQDFFRDLGTSRSSGGFGPVVPKDYTYEDGSPSGLVPLRPGEELTPTEQAEEADRYNFAIGGVRFAVAAGVGIEFNDNISLSDDNRMSDFVFRPLLDLDATWRLSEMNTLHFAVGLSYAKYFDHSEFDSDSVIVTPSSELAFTFMAGPVKITLRDRFGYQEDTYDIAVLSNRAKYGRFENQAGVRFDYGMNQWTSLTLGYDHYNLWSRGEDFDLQDRAVETIYFKPGFQITPTVKVGVNSSYSFVNFDSSDRSDGQNLMVGPYLEWQVSPYTNVYLEAGYQSLDYDGGSDFSNASIVAAGLTGADAEAVRDILRDSEDSNSYYIKLEVNNRPSVFFQHRLLGSKTSEIGFSSNFYDLYHIEYNADWTVVQGKVDLSPSVFYEHYETSGDFGEEANRIGAALGIRYHLSNSITIGLDYRYIWKDSNLTNADYYQNLAFLSVYYKF